MLSAVRTDVLLCALYIGLQSPRITHPVSMLNAIHTELKSNWSWKQRDSKLPMVGEVATTGWRSTQAYPSEIHVELLKNGLIPDPYRGFAEHEVQWVGEVEWLYKCTFDLKSGEGRHTQAELEFLGLDTVCDVYLVSAESPITCWHHDSRTYNRTMKSFWNRATCSRPMLSPSYRRPL